MGDSRGRRRDLRPEVVLRRPDMDGGAGRRAGHGLCAAGRPPSDERGTLGGEPFFQLAGRVQPGLGFVRRQRQHIPQGPPGQPGQAHHQHPQPFLQCPVRVFSGPET